MTGAPARTAALRRAPVGLVLLGACMAPEEGADGSYALRVMTPVGATVEASYRGDAVFQERLPLDGIELVQAAGTHETPGSRRPTRAVETLLGVLEAGDLGIIELGVGARYSLSESARCAPYLAAGLLVLVVEDHAPPGYEMQNFGQLDLRVGLGLECALGDGWFLDAGLDASLPLMTLDDLFDLSDSLAGSQDDLKRELAGTVVRVGFGRRF